MSNEYLILTDNTIKNIIVCASDEIADQFGAVPSYDGARIGDTYNPPEPTPEPTVWDELAAAITEGVNAV